MPASEERIHRLQMEDTMTDTTYQLTLSGTPVTISECGEGRPVLLLHGGGGPQSLGGFAAQLAAQHARVISPVHPGFGGTPRPDTLATMAGLAAVYNELLDELKLRDVLVIGNSVGGWIAAELALLGSDRIGAVVLVDAAGIDVEGHPVADIFAMTLDELAERTYYKPDSFRIDPAAMTPEQQAVMTANRAALLVYAGGPSMADPGLRARLGQIRVPALVAWGASDRVTDPDYGRAYARAIPGARFVLLPETGHLPQLESPQRLLQAVDEFTGVLTAD
jgi:pimeloyl-ACP methyl ester carboxylesterase